MTSNESEVYLPTLQSGTEGGGNKQGGGVGKSLKVNKRGVEKVTRLMSLGWAVIDKSSFLEKKNFLQLLHIFQHI